MTPTASRRERRRAWRVSRNHPDRVWSQAWREGLLSDAFLDFVLCRITESELENRCRPYAMPEPGQGTHDARTKAWRSEWR